MINIALVYCRDGALQLMLPLHELFRWETAEPLVICLIMSACLMLANELLQVEEGNETDGQMVVHQMICIVVRTTKINFNIKEAKALMNHGLNPTVVVKSNVIILQDIIHQ